jgi:hypothetical protein
VPFFDAHQKQILGYPLRVCASNRLNASLISSDDGSLLGHDRRVFMPAWPELATAMNTLKPTETTACATASKKVHPSVRKNWRYALWGKPLPTDFSGQQLAGLSAPSRVTALNAAEFLPRYTATSRSLK